MLYQVMEELEGRAGQTIAVGSFSTIASGFIADSLKSVIPWLMAMFCVIVCDLITGVRKSLLMGDHVRISRACRNTMGKMVTYFSFVVMVVMINIAAGGSMRIDTYACLLVCMIEGSSIIANILKPMGYEFNPFRLISVMLSKIMKIDKSDTEGIITKKQ